MEKARAGCKKNEKNFPDSDGGRTCYIIGMGGQFIRLHFRNFGDLYNFCTEHLTFRNLIRIFVVRPTGKSPIRAGIEHRPLLPTV